MSKYASKAVPQTPSATTEAASDSMSLREDYLPQHSRRSVAIISICFLVLTAGICLLTLIPPSAAYNPQRGSASFVGFLFSLLALWFVRANRVHAAVFSLSLLILGVQVVYQLRVGSGVRSPTTTITLLLVPFAGLLLGSRSAKIAIVTCVTWLIGLTGIELAGWIPGMTSGNAPLLIPSMGILVIIAISLYLLTERYLKAVENAVSDMTREQFARFRAESENSQTRMLVQYKDDFMAMLSHEIRTPLSGVSNGMQLLFHPKANDNMRERARRAIQQSLDNVSEVLNNLLDNSKMDAGKLQLKPEPTLLSDLMDRVVNAYALQAEAKGLTFDVACENVPMEPLELDAPRLRQMINNLISNALKFTTQGGIRVEVSAVDNQLLCFKIVDSGCGISDEDASRLFTEYVQLRNSGVQQVGTGLGLVVVKKLAQMMGGDAGVESALGRGSTFWFTVQMKLSAQALAEPA